jgi:hypothetical protein
MKIITTLARTVEDAGTEEDSPTTLIFRGYAERGSGKVRVALPGGVDITTPALDAIIVALVELTDFAKAPSMAESMANAMEWVRD